VFKCLKGTIQTFQPRLHSKITFAKGVTIVLLAQRKEKLLFVQLVLLETFLGQAKKKIVQFARQDIIAQTKRWTLLLAQLATIVQLE
jgi:hypothetical protein